MTSHHRVNVRVRDWARARVIGPVLSLDLANSLFLSNVLLAHYKI